MNLTDKEIKFLAGRKKISKFFPPAGVACLVLLIAYVTWTYYKSPLLINPNAIKTKLIEKTFETSTLTLMSLILPWTMLMLMMMALAIIAFAFSWHIQERKYLKIIDRLTKDTTSNPRRHAVSAALRRCGL